MKHLIYILFVFTFLTSCKVVEYVTVPAESTIQIVDRYVEIEIPADSSTITALLACDSLNRVYIKELSKQGTSNVTQEVQLTDNVFTVDFWSNPPNASVQVRDTFIYQQVPYPVPGADKIVYQQSWWQTMLMWTGILALVLLLLIILINRYGR